MRIRKFIVDNALFLCLLAIGLVLAVLISSFQVGPVVPVEIGRDSIYKIMLQPVEGVLTGVYIAVISIIVWRRLRESNATLSRSFARDQFWNEKYILQFVREFYPRYIESLVTRDCSDIMTDLTESFHLKHSALIKAMVDKNQEYRSEIFKIHKVEIIEVHDFINNSRDNFTAYIKVEKKKYYVINGELYGSTETKTHEELFNFKRSARSWLLDSVNVKPTVGDFFCLESFCE